MTHIEFLHRDHFARRYHRRPAGGVLAHYIDFFWETDFDTLWKTHPAGFTDLLFPNTGYSYLINLGTPFTMELGEEKREVRGDIFLPRHLPLACHHRSGNRIFGIKFRVSPVVLEKRINFSEYRDYLFPLAYLIDPGAVRRIKGAPGFAQRVAAAETYYEGVLHRFGDTQPGVQVVTSILEEAARSGSLQRSIEEWAAQFRISSRTLRRYFEGTTGAGAKDTLQLLRIRAACTALTENGRPFDATRFGYFDASHFHKELRAFMGREHAARLLQSV